MIRTLNPVQHITSGEGGVAREGGRNVQRDERKEANSWTTSICGRVWMDPGLQGVWWGCGYNSP